MKPFIDLTCFEKKIRAIDLYRMILDLDIIRSHNGSIFLHSCYNYWKCIVKNEEHLYIRKLLFDNSQDQVTNEMINEVLQRLKTNPSIQHDFSANPYENLMNVLNGVYNTSLQTLLEYRKEYYFTYILSFNYLNKERSSPSFDKFTQISLKCDVNPSKVKLLLQILGYALSDLQGAKVAFFLIGESNSGKSVLLKMISEILDDDLISRVPFSMIDQRFNISQLQGKKLNICDEVSCSKIKNSDLFKSIVSGEKIQAERKGRDPFNFTVKAKLLSAGNTLPIFGSVDGTDSVSNRLIVLKFGQSVGKEDWDLELVNKLVKEKDSIISNAVDELKELQIKNFEFTIPDDSQRAINEYRRNQNSLTEFLNTSCILESKQRIHKCALWTNYLEFCQENGYERLLTQMQFNQKICSLPYIESGRFRMDNRNVAGWYGIGIREMDFIGTVGTGGTDERK